jgi:hypothetical protein
MGTLAELWDAPEADVAPKPSRFSTFKQGTEIGPAKSTLADLWDAPETTQAAEQPTPKQSNLVGSILQKAFEAKQAIPQTIAGNVAGAIDMLAGVPNFVGYGVGRAFGLSPEEAQKASSKVPEAIAQPVGRLTGLAQTEAYKTSIPVSIQNYIGEHLNESAQSIASKFGLPVQDVQAVMEAGIAATGVGAGKFGKGVVSAAKELAPSMPKVRIETQVPPTAVTTGSVGAAKVNTNPLIGQISGEESVRGTYPQYKVSKIGEDVPQPEQGTRASVINRVYQDIGKENNQIRQGVLTGNEDTLRTEHTKAAMANPTPEGELLKRQIADEQNTLSQFAENRVKNTGADQNLLYPAERGERINDFFAGVAPKGESPSSLPSLFKQEKSKLFQEASDKVGSNPIQTGNVDTLLNDPQFAAGLKLTNTQGVAEGARSLIELAKTVGFKDDMGNFHAANTIDAWAAVRKALNANWTKENAKVIRKINESIDKDIASAGGGDLLKKANDLHKMEKELFGSKGIKDVFGEIDSNGVETGKVSFDKLPEKLNSMPPNQWKHIYDVADKMASGKLVSKTLDKEGNPLWTLDVPPEVQRSAQLAKNEMLGSLAREIQAAGAGKSDVWLHDAVNKVLNARADKIAYAFPLEEQQAFRDLNAAGYLMPGKHSYEGGGQQIRRVGMIEGNLGKLGATTGAGLGTAIAGPTGGAIGGYLGGKAGVAGSEVLATRALTKEAEASLKKMQKNAELGKNKLKDIGKE